MNTRTKTIDDLIAYAQDAQDLEAYSLAPVTRIATHVGGHGIYRSQHQLTPSQRSALKMAGYHWGSWRCGDRMVVGWGY